MSSSSRPVYRMCAQVAPSGESGEKGPLDRMLAKNRGAVCFWQPIPSGLNPVAAAVLHDILCVVSLLRCMADCCMLYTMCKVEWFVLTIIKQRLLLLFKKTKIYYYFSYYYSLH